MTANRCEAGLVGRLRNVFRDNRFGVDYTRCRRKVTRALSVGCVHEHVVTWRVCVRCSAALVDQVNDEREVRCVECLYIDGHACRVLVTVNELVPEGAA